MVNDEFFLSRPIGHPLRERDNKTQFGIRIYDFNKLSSAGGGGFEEAGGGKIAHYILILIHLLIRHWKRL